MLAMTIGDIIWLIGGIIAIGVLGYFTYKDYKAEREGAFKYFLAILALILVLVIVNYLTPANSGNGGVNHYINPVAIKLGNTEIRWYAICILTGVVIALWHGIKEGRRLGINSDFIYVGILITLPLAILGARLWYVLFNLDKFHSFEQVIGLKGGLSGLAIQGGVIAALITVFIYCRVKHVDFYKVLDILAPGFLIGQICGRWGNFCNHELYGAAISNVSLFKGLLPSFITENLYCAGAYRHPAFFYESIGNMIGLILFFVIRSNYKKLKSGDGIGFYLTWYGIVRIATENVRAKSGANEVLMAGPIKVSVLVSIIFIVCGVGFLVAKRFIGPKKMYRDILKEVEENHINTVIFDIDGTILDTQELINRTFVATFEKYFPGYILSDEELESFFGPPLKETFSKYEKDEERMNEIIAYYREWNAAHHEEFIKICPGAKDCLRILHKKKYNIAVVSSKRTDVILLGLKIYGLDKYIDIIVGEDDVTKPKPDPEGIYKALEHFPDAKNPMYVGDTPSDILAGKNANIKTCGVMYSSKIDKVIELEPNYLVKNLNDIIKIVGE